MVDTQKFRIRRMRATDLDTVLDLEHQSFSDPWLRQAFRDTMYYDHGGAFVLEEPQGDNWRLVGYTCYYSAGGETHLTNIAVEPSRRGKRWGDALLAQILATAFKDGSDALFLEVRPSNESAIRFYQRHGFRELHRRKKYYSHPEEDAVVMVREFTATEMELPGSSASAPKPTEADSLPGETDQKRDLR